MPTEANAQESSSERCGFKMTPDLEPNLFDTAGKVHSTLIRLLEACKSPNPANIDEANLRRWLLYLSVLILESAGSALCLSFHGFQRTVDVLARQVFELTYKGLYLAKHIDQATALSDSVAPQYKRLFEQLADKRDEQLASVIAKFTREFSGVQMGGRNEGRLNFYAILRELEPADYEYLYAAHYEVPGYLLHGHPVGMLDVFRFNEGAVSSWHHRSLLGDVNLKLCTITWCEARYCLLLRDAFEVSDQDLSGIETLVADWRSIETRVQWLGAVKRT